MTEGRESEQSTAQMQECNIVPPSEAQIPEAASTSSSSTNGGSTASRLGRSSITATRSYVTTQRMRNRRGSAHHADETFSSLNASHHEYQWRMHAPNGVGRFLQWLVTGHAKAPPPSEQENKDKIRNLARTLCLLREYESKYGMPNGGDKKEQEWVLEELCKRLFASGVPIWVLQPVMGIAANSLTGLDGFDFSLLPASGIIIPPQEAAGYSTHFFQTQGAFCMYRLNMYEKVLARLASFGTNTRTINSVPDEYLPKLLMQDVRQYNIQQDDESLHDKEAVVKEILDLASRGYGLFFLTRVEEILKQQQQERLANEDDESGDGCFMSDGEESVLSYRSFWEVDESIRELFTRLATIEAAECLDAIERSPSLSEVWPRRYVVLFRVLSSAGSSALWFNGSWQDMLLSGGIAGAVALIFQTNTHLWKNQRMIFEVVVSFVVGLTAGLIAIRMPDTTCFSAIAIASMIDYLRGFGIVFSVMEVMSKNTMSGSADFIEAIVFSFLIAMSILFGLGAAEGIMGINQTDESNSMDYMTCTHDFSELWFILIVPVASLGWAAGFRPDYRDLPLMTFHGVLAYSVSWAVERASENTYFGSFVASFTTSTVAGLVSRFTGRQALGDTFTGLFALVPGIFITEGIFAFAFDDVNEESTLLLTLLLKAVIIGVGSWCGTLLCAPTILGTNAGILSSETKEHSASENLGAMLFI